MPNPTKSLVFAVSLVFMFAGTTSMAVAQEEENWLVSMMAMTTTTGPTTGPTAASTTALATTGGGILLTVVLLTDDDSDQVEAYLRQNAVAVQHDLHVGGGETTRDLAAMFAIPDDELESFSEILYDNRQTLASLSQPGGVDSEGARQFRNIVIAEMLDQRRLQPGNDDRWLAIERNE